MFNIITAEIGSIKFDKFEKRIIKKLLEYARTNFENGNGSYLASFDFNKINFKWCSKMSSFLDLKNENQAGVDAILGAWSPGSFNSIFVAPNFYSNGFLDYLSNKIDVYNEILKDGKEKFKDAISKKNIATVMVQDLSSYVDTNNELYKKYRSNDVVFAFIRKYSDYLLEDFCYNYDFSDERLTKKISAVKMHDCIIHKSYIKDLNRFKIISNFFFQFFENRTIKESDVDDENYISLMTICHELYHKWQFSASPIMPVFYIANFFLSLFFGYFTTSENRWFIEGDVRKFVDNKENCLKFVNLHNSLVYITMLGKIFYMEQIFDNNEHIKKLWLNGIADFNNSFKNSFDVKEIIDKYKNEEWSNNCFSIDEKAVKYDIKNTYEFNFMLKLLKEEDLLTKEFIKYLEEK